MQALMSGNVIHIGSDIPFMPARGCLVSHSHQSRKFNESILSYLSSMVFSFPKQPSLFSTSKP